MTRGSSKPCPGCGKTSSYRKADEVCMSCKALLNSAAKWKQQLVMLESGADQIVVAIGKQSYWNEYIHDHIRNGKGYGRSLMDIFQRLALASSRPAVELEAEYKLLGKIDPGGTMHITMPRSLAEVIKELHQFIQPMLDEVYSAGKHDGHRLLMRLAEGDLSPNEFLEETE